MYAANVSSLRSRERTPTVLSRERRSRSTPTRAGNSASFQALPSKSRASGTVRSKTRSQGQNIQLTESFADGLYNGIVIRKEDPAFLRDLLISDPDGEFTAAAFDQFNVLPERVFDGGRHTGGTWPVRRSD